MTTHTRRIRRWVLTCTIGVCIGVSATTASAQVVTSSIADQRLHFVSSGHVYYAETPQTAGQPIGEGALLLRTANGRPLIAKAWQSGLPLIEEAGSSVVAIKTGQLIRIARPAFSRPRGATAPVFTSLILHEADAGTGRIVRTQIFTRRQLASIWQIESESGLDLNADGVLGSRIYVNAAASGENTGQTWPDALTDLQDALDRAGSGMEIWIVGGLTNRRNFRGSPYHWGSLTYLNSTCSS